MEFKRKTLRYGALGAVVLVGSHIVPHHEEDECELVGMNLCSAEENFYVPRNEQVPHGEHDPSMPNAYRWIASGQVNSISTGPSYFLPAGERLIR